MEKPSTETFSLVASKWYASVEPDLKITSQVRYLNILQTYLYPAFGSAPITSITRESFNTYRLSAMKTGGAREAGLSPATLSAVYSVFRSVMNYARTEEGFTTDDFSRISFRQIQHPLRVFSLAEQQRLSEHLFRDLSLTDLGILTALYMGLRIGEVCALRWRDIDLQDMNLHVNHTMQRIQTFEESPRTRVLITSPKSPCSIRTIPIPSLMQPAFLSHRKAPDHFLLSGEAAAFVEPRTMENRFHRILKQCDIQNASFHTCRHTFATRCVELGFDVKSLSEILGHASVNITMNRYVHPSMEFKRRNMDRLEELMK